MDKLISGVTTFMNPAGFVEQHYIGAQTGRTVSTAVAADMKLVKKLQKQNKEALILVDLTEVTSTNLQSHKAAIKGMTIVPYRRVSIYGPLPLRILLNTLGIVADRHENVKAFATRSEAIEWLKKGS